LAIRPNTNSVLEYDGTVYWVFTDCKNAYEMREKYCTAFIMDIRYLQTARMPMKWEKNLYSLHNGFGKPTECRWAHNNVFKINLF
jgi:hypothetical protein